MLSVEKAIGIDAISVKTAVNRRLKFVFMLLPNYIVAGVPLCSARFGKLNSTGASGPVKATPASGSGSIGIVF